MPNSMQNQWRNNREMRRNVQTEMYDGGERVLWEGSRLGSLAVCRSPHPPKGTTLAERWHKTSYVSYRRNEMIEL
jgi:hypothetical protein